MKIRFTEKGDMEIRLEGELEREVFPCIVRDARSLGEEWLSDSLGPDFDDAWFGEWQEWVQPEVQEAFNAELDSLKRFGQPKNDLIFVPANQVEKWYGAVNQARMALEAIFHFSEEELEGDDEELAVRMEQWPLEKQGSFQRAHFYAWFQQILLEGLSHFAPGALPERGAEPSGPDKQ